MMPGVRYLPEPSTTRASAGGVTVVPTCAIRPFTSTTDPLRIVGPAAVMIVTLRITVGRDAKGRYVLGKGSALGAERPPAPALPGRPAASRRAVSAGALDGAAETWAGVGELCVVRVPEEQLVRTAIDARVTIENRM